MSVERERRTPLARPADERTADQSTQEAGGLHGSVRPGPGPELPREADVEDVLNRNAEERYETPRRYEHDSDADPALPTNDATLNTKI